MLRRLLRVERIFSGTNRIYSWRNLGLHFALLLRVHTRLARLVCWIDQLHVSLHWNLELCCFLGWLGLRLLHGLLVSLRKRTVESERQVWLVTGLFRRIWNLSERSPFLEREVIAVSSAWIVCLIKCLRIFGSSRLVAFSRLFRRLYATCRFKGPCLAVLTACDAAGGRRRLLSNYFLIGRLVKNANHGAFARIVF